MSATYGNIRLTINTRLTFAVGYGIMVAFNYIGLCAIWRYLVGRSCSMRLVYSFIAFCIIIFPYVAAF